MCIRDRARAHPAARGHLAGARAHPAARQPLAKRHAEGALRRAGRRAEGALRDQCCHVREIAWERFPRA
eukprot:8664585-Alexandrium_andersonii.AAC.1